MTKGGPSVALNQKEYEKTTAPRVGGLIRKLYSFYLAGVKGNTRPDLQTRLENAIFLFVFYRAICPALSSVFLSVGTGHRNGPSRIHESEQFLHRIFHFFAFAPFLLG